MQVVTKKTKCLRARIEVRPTALQSWLTPTLTLTSTFNPLQRDIVMTHTRAKVWVTDQSIQKVEGTNGRTDTTDCSTLSANADTDNSLVSVEFGCLNRPRYFGRAPAPYLSQHCIAVSSADTRRHLRSANRQLLAVPRFRLNTYGRRAFSVAVPMAWNSLPDFIRDPRAAQSVWNVLGVLDDYALYKYTQSVVVTRVCACVQWAGARTRKCRRARGSDGRPTVALWWDASTHRTQRRSAVSTTSGQARSSTAPNVSTYYLQVICCFIIITSEACSW